MPTTTSDSPAGPSSNPVTTREDALDAVAALVREHGLTMADIRTRLHRDLTDEPRSGSGVLGRILAALGGTFVFAGLAIFIGINWEAMNTAARIIVTLGSGLAAFVMALVAAGDARYARATTPLFLVAAALQPTGILVAINEFSSGGDWRLAVLVTTAIMVSQQAAVLWKFRLDTLLFTTLTFSLWFLGTALDLLDVDPEWIGLLLGAATVGLCVGLERTRYRSTTTFWYFVGGGAFFGGLFGVVEDLPIEPLFLLFACGGVVLSVVVRRRSLLAASTIAILGYVSYFTSTYFADSLGWPLVLVLLGIALLVLSGMALRINRRYLQQA